jgi:hypothetical protein
MRIEHPRCRSTYRFVRTTNPKTAGKEKEEKEAHEKAQEGTANTVGLAAEAAAQKAMD